MKAIVITLFDWIEEMMVTPGTGHRRAHENRAYGVGLFGENLGAIHVFTLVAGILSPGSQSIEAHGNESVLIARRQFITGELFQDKAVKGFVVVEGLDDVIAIAPGGSLSPSYSNPSVSV